MDAAECLYTQSLRIHRKKSLKAISSHRQLPVFSKCKGALQTSQRHVQQLRPTQICTASRSLCNQIVLPRPRACYFRVFNIVTLLLLGGIQYWRSKFFHKCLSPCKCIQRIAFASQSFYRQQHAFLHKPHRPTSISNRKLRTCLRPPLASHCLCSTRWLYWSRRKQLPQCRFCRRPAQKSPNEILRPCHWLLRRRAQTNIFRKIKVQLTYHRIHSALRQLRWILYQRKRRRPNQSRRGGRPNYLARHFCSPQTQASHIRPYERRKKRLF